MQVSKEFPGNFYRISFIVTLTQVCIEFSVDEQSIWYTLPFSLVLAILYTSPKWF